MSSSNILRLLRDALALNGEKLDLASGDVLSIRPIANDTGSINIGDGTNDMDVKVFLGSSGDYVLLDVGNARLQLEDVDLLLNDSNVNLGDNDDLTFGDGSDVQLLWDGTRLTAGPASGFWAGCPSKADPDWMSKAYIYEFQGTEHGVDGAHGWIAGTNTNGSVAVGDAVTANTPGVGGYLTLSTDGSAQYDYATIKLTGLGGAGCPVKITENSGLKMWFETKVIPASVTDKYFMLGLGAANADDVTVDATGAESIDDGFYFRTMLATETELDTETNQSGSATEVKGNAATVAANTALKLGMYFDGVTTLTFYVNGTALDDTVTIGDAGNVPNDVGLTPFFHLKDGVAGGSASALYVEYVKLVQLKA
jgi:hypothetical protein